MRPFNQKRAQMPLDKWIGNTSQKPQRASEVDGVTHQGFARAERLELVRVPEARERPARLLIHETKWHLKPRDVRRQLERPAEVTGAKRNPLVLELARRRRVRSIWKRGGRANRCRARRQNKALSAR